MRNGGTAAARWLTMLVLGAGGCEPDVFLADKEPIEELVPIPEAEDTDLAEVGEARLEVSPRLIDFGYVPEGMQVEGEFSLWNHGTVPLDITGILLNGAPVFAVAGNGSLQIAPGSSDTITVVYTSTAEEVEGVLSFATNDPGFPSVDLDVLGNGVNPLLLGSPLDFGVVTIGESEVRSLPLHNPGNAVVTVSQITSTDAHFQVGLVAPVQIPAGDTVNVEVVFTPDDALDYAALLVMDSDARVVPDVVSAIGTGASVPVALCGADPPVVAALHDTFHFDASQSYDPGGRPITAQWQLVSVPSGSSVTLPSNSGARVGPIAPEVVGNYVAQVIVTNDLGVSSEPCVATAVAEADADLWVEMTWQYDEDIDLHLIRNNAAFNSTAGDCYYANCRNRLSWDAPGSADDPILDRDDRTGTGPENINLTSPASNTYRVVIYDFPDSRHSGSNNVRVKVYLAGVLRHDSVHTMYGERDQIDVALIDWTVSPPTVTPL
jgi:hypothetical protein